MGIDPRRLTAIQIQLDALAQETGASVGSSLHAALSEVGDAIGKCHKILKDQGQYIEVPEDNKHLDPDLQELLRGMMSGDVIAKLQGGVQSIDEFKKHRGETEESIAVPKKDLKDLNIEKDFTSGPGVDSIDILKR